jgi:hypothetical protein
MKKITAKFAAEEMGFVKINGRWWSDLYLEMLDATPYFLGANVYISDGVEIQESGLTNDEMIKEYEDYLKYAE